MPKINNSKHPVQRCFPPLIRRLEFRPERRLTTKLSLKRHEFSADIEIPAVVGLTRAPSSIRSLDDKLIPKPNGEVTRLDRGGYNLLEATQWEESLYGDIQGYVHTLAARFLDLGQPYSKQGSTKMLIVYDEAKARYPILKKYANNWVVSDMLKMHLKNTSQKAKSRRQEEPAE